MLLNMALQISWAQSDAQSGDNPQTNSGAVSVPVQDNVPAASNDNPPISGLDQPSLEARVPSRSFLIPGAHISESVDSNLGNGLGNASLHGVTRLLGDLALEKLWSRYDASLTYVGGGAFYSSGTLGSAQIHQLDASQRVRWRTGQLTIRDSFSYLPEGLFGYTSYGGVGGYSGISTPGTGMFGAGLGGFFGSGQFVSLGQESRVTNVAIADVTQSLSPRSSVTVAGSYGLVHFINDNTGFINSGQTVAQAGYDYRLSRRDQIGVIYGYQSFRYPAVVGTEFSTQILNILYGHRISGRMDLVVGGGPQFTHIKNVFTGSVNQISGSGRAALRYRLTHASVSLAYYHANTSGSGFFGGARSDVAVASLSRPFGRLWSATFDVGYNHGSRIAPTPSGIGIGAKSYSYAYLGGTAHRVLGRDFSLLLSYQFNRLLFDNSFCAAGGSCSSQRHVAMVGLDWHPRPIRLD
jgi:hypothetical protein